MYLVIFPEDHAENIKYSSEFVANCRQKIIMLSLSLKRQIARFSIDSHNCDYHSKEQGLPHNGLGNTTTVRVSSILDTENQYKRWNESMSNITMPSSASCIFHDENVITEEFLLRSWSFRLPCLHVLTANVNIVSPVWREGNLEKTFLQNY